MAFKNEYVPPLEQETSEFFRQARETLRTGYSQYDAWTVDREREMVLLYRGSGHSMEDRNEEAWSFIDRKGRYFICTTLLSKCEVSPDEIAISRSFSFMTGGDRIAPNPATVACIKEALNEHSRRYLFDLEHYKFCQLKVVDAVTGKEI